MSHQPTRSLRYDYNLYLEQEIENYKESVPRSALLDVGNEAVRVLATQQQFTLTELVVCEEVDRLIFRRLKLPSYTTWRKRRLNILAEMRRPENWRLTSNATTVRDATLHDDGQVLVAGADLMEMPALYLAANGCRVTALIPEHDAVERVMLEAARAGIAERLHGEVGELATWSPHSPLGAVVVMPSAFEGLSNEDRRRVMETLMSATVDGGVHLVQTIVAAGKRDTLIDELRQAYLGWEISLEAGPDDAGERRVFQARKSAA